MVTEPFRIFVIGASAGGVETLVRLCRLLPESLPAAVFIVLHTPPDGPGLLPTILERHSLLPAVYPRNGEPIAPGKIYVAPPDHHLKVCSGTIELWRGPRVNLLRPAADVTFDSAAEAYGPLTTGIVLSGTRSDGTAGLVSIKNHGGITIAQAPDEAIFPGMPQSAIESMAVDYILTIEEIAKMIVQITQSSAEGLPPIQEDPPEQAKGPVVESMEYSKRVVAQDRERFTNNDLDKNTRTTLTCPECGGVLVETHQGDLTRYECQIGHGFSENSFVDGHAQMVEYALWAAVRALDERTLLFERLSSRAEEQGRRLMSERFLATADEARKSAEVIRGIVHDGKTPLAEALPEDDENSKEAED